MGVHTYHGVEILQLAWVKMMFLLFGMYGHFIFKLSIAIDNYSTLCLDDPALQTHCLIQYITVPCCLPAGLAERGHTGKVSEVMCIVPSPQATLAESKGIGAQASFIRGGGGYFGQDPPTQLWTHPPNF